MGEKEIAKLILWESQEILETPKGKVDYELGRRKDLLVLTSFFPPLSDIPTHIHILSLFIYIYI
jgi:hypothetical protein